MKDYSKYTYQELYDMLNHINPFEYPERILAVEEEVVIRKNQGEIPEKLVQKQRYSFDDIIDFSLVWFAISQLIGSVVSLVLVGIFIRNFSSQIEEGSGIIFILLLTITFGITIWGAIVLFKKRLNGIQILFAGLFSNAFVISVFAGFQKIYFYRIVFEQEIITPRLIDNGIYFPASSLLFLLIVYNIFSRSLEK